MPLTWHRALGEWCGWCPQSQLTSAQTPVPIGTLCPPQLKPRIWEKQDVWQVGGMGTRPRNVWWCRVTSRRGICVPSLAQAASWSEVRQVHSHQAWAGWVATQTHPRDAGKFCNPFPSRPPSFVLFPDWKVYSYALIYISYFIFISCAYAYKESMLFKLL